MTQKITEARVTVSKSMFDIPSVFVTIDGKEEKLFDFYPDEISFSSFEFIGLTKEEAKKIKYTKDLNYLRS
mgnify:CR=1 FL=1